MTFAERLRQLRDAAGMSEAKLAEASGVSFSSIHEYGLGRRKPSFAAVVKIARALAVTCEAFADCEDMTDEAKAAGKKTGKPQGRARRSKKSAE
jgi:transcriptional regulator with XRE-family HTH domain